MLTTHQIYSELRQALDAEAAEKLADILSGLFEEVRRSVPRTDFLELHAVVRELAAAQKRTEERVAELAEAQKSTEAALTTLTQRVDQLTQRMDQLTQRVDQLTQRMDQLTQRVDQLTQRVDQLTQRVDQLTQRVDQLTQRVDQLTQRVDELAQAQKQMTEQFTKWMEQADARFQDHTNRLGKLEGRSYELSLKEKLDSYFGRLIRRPQVVRVSDLLPQLEEKLTDDEIDDLTMIDLVVSGRTKKSRPSHEVYLGVEASETLDDHDLDRAQRRSDLLRKAGFPAVPVMAGLRIHPAVLERAQERKAIVLLDHTPHNVETAMADIG